MIIVYELLISPMEKQLQGKIEDPSEAKATPQEMLTAERALLVNRLRILEELSAHWEETNAFFKMIEEVSNQIQELDTKLKAA